MVGRPRISKCGSDTGYVYHLRKQETPCAICKQAHNEYQRNYNKQRKGK
jgi:cytidine deaminase